MQTKYKVLSIFGTRPEAIKMAPVVQELAGQPQIESLVCVTAQHRQMLDQVLHLFKIKPDFDLNIMKENQSLWEITTQILQKTKTIFEEIKPNLVLVHGDTTTALASSLSAFYAKIPVGHIEAGLRTFNKQNPFPEELNRVMVDQIASLHFAPTQKTANNLLAEGFKSSSIHITGNTVIDALLQTIDNYPGILPALNLSENLKTILVTTHRRENFGQPLVQICAALKQLIAGNQNLQIVFPVHPNPQVRQTVYENLVGLARIHLIEPLDYIPFANLMKKADLILTDSGGVQEEAPALGKPVLVLREETERPEALECGTIKLVGHNSQVITRQVQALLDDQQAYQQMASAKNPYGDGQAAKKIVEIIVNCLTDF